MRFEHRAAYVMGVGLPLLEVLRRKTDFSTIAGYVDDFIVGGLLIYAALSVSGGKRGGPVLLVVAWAVLCGGLYGSFFWQLENPASHDVGGLPNMVVVAIKGVLYAISLVALFMSARSAIDREASLGKD